MHKPESIRKTHRLKVDYALKEVFRLLFIFLMLWLVIYQLAHALS